MPSAEDNKTNFCSKKQRDANEAIQIKTFCPQCGHNATADLQQSEGIDVVNISELQDKAQAQLTEQAIQEKKKNEFIIENGVLTKYNGDGREVTIPCGVSEIGENAFKDCNTLTRVVIPNGVTKIGINAFFGCSVLEEAVIPNSVKDIERGAFAFCTLTGFSGSGTRIQGPEDNPFSAVAYTCPEPLGNLVRCRADRDGSAVEIITGLQLRHPIRKFTGTATDDIAVRSHGHRILVAGKIPIVPAWMS